MCVQIFEPELIERRGFNGFYRHFLSALVSECGARPTSAPRPLPRMVSPREHESCWVQWGDALVFFDMSDHVQLFDLDALDRCTVYFKANLHRYLARRILARNGRAEAEDKLRPFLFFSEGLHDFMRDAARRRRWKCDRPKYDVCFVMGVYENPVRYGGRSPFEHPDEPVTPASCHFWVRWHLLQALQEAGIQGYYRLTSRAVRSLEDRTVVHSNLSRKRFSRCMSNGRITGVCTWPHALFPWKASESFALGRPIFVEQAPLTETPEPFRIEPDRHFIELFPGAGAFDNQADPQSPLAYRVLNRLPFERIRERAEWLREILQDRERLDAMGAACRDYAQQEYDPRTVAHYIRTEVERREG